MVVELCKLMKECACKERGWGGMKRGTDRNRYKRTGHEYNIANQYICMTEPFT